MNWFRCRVVAAVAFVIAGPALAQNPDAAFRAALDEAMLGPTLPLEVADDQRREFAACLARRIGVIADSVKAAIVASSGDERLALIRQADAKVTGQTGPFTCAVDFGLPARAAANPDREALLGDRIGEMVLRVGANTNQFALADCLLTAARTILLPWQQQVIVETSTEQVVSMFGGFTFLNLEFRAAYDSCVARFG